MKSRSGFVSNSSSSSFICEICGSEICGMDICLDDYGFCECVNEHIMCQDHLLEVDGVIYEDSYDVPEKYCPLCQFKEVSIDDINRYLLQISGYKNDEEVEEVILKKFNSYSELCDFLSKKG